MVSMMSISSCLSSSTQFNLLLFPVPKSHIICLFRKKNIIVTGSYNSIREISAQPFEKKTEVLLTVHLFEVRNLVEIAHIDDSKVLDPISDAYKYARSISIACMERGTSYGTGLRLVSCNQGPSHDQSG